VLAQPVGTVIYAVQKMGSVLGKSVVVLGQGPIGLSFTDLVARAGAIKVIVSDVVDSRLEIAKKVGATHTINAARENVIETVKEITKGEMADFSVEACGLPETCNQACNVLKMHGTTIIFGMPHGDPIFPFDWAGMYYKLPNIIVTNSARAGEVVDNVKIAVDLFAQGKLDPSFMVTHKVPFAELSRAYEMFSRRTDGAVKVLITL
jgi:L-iditol 2-dehydrogenase